LNNDGTYSLPPGKNTSTRGSVLLQAVEGNANVARRLTATVAAGQPAGNGYVIKREGSAVVVLTLNPGESTIWEFSNLGRWSQVQ
jgi:hypothetical protein